MSSLGVGVLRDEIEGDGAAGALVEVHDVVEAEMMRVVAVVAATGAQLAALVLPGRGQVGLDWYKHMGLPVISIHLSLDAVFSYTRLGD